jgi:acetoin utilization deacetylase AcuC-like enzyme
MHVLYSDQFVLPLPPEHRFPIQKYALLHQQAVAEQMVPSTHLHEPSVAADADVLRAHAPAYLARLMQGSMSTQEMRKIGFPWTPALVERERRVAGATIDACRWAMRDGCAANLAGGTHHAFRDHGAGYCVFNDGVVAARVAQAEGLVQRVVVLDCDVHQGDGTAALVRDDPTIFAFSIHGAKNYPFHKQQGDLDVALPDGTADDAYLSALQDGVRIALARARADLAIYVAGADPYADDRLGRLAVSQAGLQTRDALIYDACDAAGLPLVITMAGGYARNIADTVAIHAATIRSAATRYR